jgi:hypothetical protein
LRGDSVVLVLRNPNWGDNWVIIIIIFIFCEFELFFRFGLVYLRQIWTFILFLKRKYVWWSAEENVAWKLLEFGDSFANTLYLIQCVRGMQIWYIAASLATCPHYQWCTSLHCRVGVWETPDL